MFSALVFARVTLCALVCACALPGVAHAEAATPTPVPSPTSSAEVANDPCGGPGRLLATLDRPTVGFSTCAVPKGAIVLEDGYQNQTQATAPQASVSYPVGFQRFGVADRFEVDLIGPNFNRARSDGSLATGASDAGLGFKAELPPRGRFTYAIDGLVTAATGTGGFGAGGPVETLDVDVAYAASPAVGIATTLAGTSSAGSFASANGASPTVGATQRSERFGYFLPSVVVTAQIPNAYQFYVEFVGQTKLGPRQSGRVFADLGLQKLFGPNLEVDAEYADSFTPVGGSRFHYVGVGAGIRVR